MKEKLYKFMAGRNGANQFSRFLSITALVLLVSSLISSMVFKNNVGTFLSYMALPILLYSNFIVFSKNLTKRRAENQDFLNLKYKIFHKFKNIKTRFSQRKEYKFFKCSNCKTLLRVPKGKGKIKVHCKKCGNDMIKKS
ncbi:hypothetical protein [Miniphocaeibacter massiliensis]|uniref:hypothetical protein n=1 Tax=Miniphocaeibacter massiliensis TaxID=2041841 RepID=UPI000C1C4515|nr:hypothetical protein [Miniphocaeibacter massiliensis]